MRCCWCHRGQPESARCQALFSQCCVGGVAVETLAGPRLGLLPPGPAQVWGRGGPGQVAGRLHFTAPGDPSLLRPEGLPCLGKACGGSVSSWPPGWVWDVCVLPGPGADLLTLLSCVSQGSLAQGLLPRLTTPAVTLAPLPLSSPVHGVGGPVGGAICRAERTTPSCMWSLL